MSRWQIEGVHAGVLWQALASTLTLTVYRDGVLSQLPLLLVLLALPPYSPLPQVHCPRTCNGRGGVRGRHRWGGGRGKAPSQQFSHRKNPCLYLSLGMIAGSTTYQMPWGQVLGVQPGPFKVHPPLISTGWEDSSVRALEEALDLFDSLVRLEPRCKMQLQEEVKEGCRRDLRGSNTGLENLLESRLATLFLASCLFLAASSSRTRRSSRSRREKPTLPAKTSPGGQLPPPPCP